MIEAIEKAKKITLPRFIYALGILHVGEETALDLAEHFGDLKSVLEAPEEEINSISNIGDVVA